MVWAAISADGKSYTIRFNGNVTARRYQDEALGPGLVPFINRHVCYKRLASNPQCWCVRALALEITRYESYREPLGSDEDSYTDKAKPTNKERSTVTSRQRRMGKCQYVWCSTPGPLYAPTVQIPSCRQPVNICATDFVLISKHHRFNMEIA